MLTCLSRALPPHNAGSAIGRRSAKLPLPLAGDRLDIRFGQKAASENRPGNLVSVGTLEDPTTRKPRVYYHNTLMFREAETLGRLPDMLNAMFPDGAPVEIYAGSNGSDALSMGILMLDALGKERAAKFPVTSSDLFPHLQDRARQGIVGLMPVNAEKGWEAAEQQWRTMSHMAVSHKTREGTGITGKLSDYLDPTPIPAHAMSELRLQGCQNREQWQTYDWWADHAAEEDLHPVRPEMMNVLAKNITFDTGAVDAVAALSQPLAKEQAQTPRIVMLRNVLYMMDGAQLRQLRNALRDNMPRGSVLVLGESDVVDYAFRFYDSPRFLNSLERAGWQPGNDVPNTFIKIR